MERLCYVALDLLLNFGSEAIFSTRDLRVVIDSDVSMRKQAAFVYLLHPFGSPGATLQYASVVVCLSVPSCHHGVNQT